MKYTFEGIGDKSATAVMLLMSATGYGHWFTIGLQGSIIHFVLKLFFMWIASNGLVILNIGISNIQIWAEKGTYDGTMDGAIKLVESKKGGLTDDEKKKIDDRVIAAFNKFASFQLNP